MTGPFADREQPDEDLPTRLLHTLSLMIEIDETISTRNVMKRMPEDFRYPAAVSRPVHLRKLFLDAQRKQKAVRVSASQLGNPSRAQLECAVAKRDAHISELEARVQILVASHRALYAAVGEMGGAAAWLRFFEKHKRVLETLDQLQARAAPQPPLRLVVRPQTDSSLEGDEIPY